MRRWGSVAAALCLLHVAPGDGPPAVTLLVANVGNVDMITDGPCAEWPARGALCAGAVEDEVAAAIRARDPDVIALQEVMPRARCTPDAPGDVCDRPGEPIRRLVGPAHTIVCDGIGGYDCAAFRTAAFTVRGCAAGAICIADTPPQPPPCAGHADFSAVFAVDTTWRDRPIRWVIAHPYQAMTDEEDPCRAAQLAQALAELPGDATTVVAGDFNVDPDRLRYWFASPDVWFRHVGPGRRFRARHDGLLIPPPTWLVYAFDRVVADRAIGGGCATKEPLARGLDHRALWCVLEPR